MKLPRPTLETIFWFVLLGTTAFFSILFLGQNYDANDLLFQFAPWRQFLKQSLAQGVLPLWNPYSFGGQPFFADLQTQMLYPPNWLTLLPSVPTGMSWFIALHWGIAVFGMRRWLKTLDLSEDASRVGALLFAFSGFFWWEIIHPPVLAAFAWCPWWFAALETLTHRPTARNGWWAGAAYAMLFLSGSFQLTLGASYVGLAYVLIRFGWNDRKEDRPSISTTKVLSIGAAMLLGSLLLVMQLQATQVFSRLSVRENAGKNYDQFNAYWSLQPSTLGQYLFPRLGLPHDKTIESAIQEVTGDGGQKASADNIGNDYLANFGYLGVWLPLLVFFAFRERQKRLAILLSSLAALTLLLCFGKHFFLHRLLCDLAPGFSILRAPFRFQYLYLLMMVPLAAMGYQALAREGVATGETRFRRTLVASYGVLALLFCLTDPTQCWREMLGILLGAAGLFLVGNPSLSKLGRILTVAGLVGPLLLSGWGDFEVHPSSNLGLVRNTPWLDSVKSRSTSRQERLWLDQQLPYIMNTGSGEFTTPAPTNATCVWNLKSPSGYNPLHLQSFAEIQSLPFPVFSKLAAIHRLFFQKKLPQDIPGYTLATEDPLAVYESSDPRPYSYDPPHWILEEDPQRRLMRLNDPSFDPYQTSLLDEKPPSLTVPDFQDPPAFVGTLLDETPNQQHWKVETSAPLIAVFADSAYPGWVARVDGKDTPILEVNHGFRAIPLPAGSHEVDFRFEPWWASLLVPILVLWLAVGLGFLFGSRLPFKIGRSG